MGSQAFCELDKVTVDYLDDSTGKLRALENLNLTVNKGESLAIIGPSGCGKSTLLRLLSGLFQPNEGTVCIDGVFCTKPREGTALISQSYGLLPWKTIRANAELGLELQGMSRMDRRKRAEEALKLVGLEDFQNAYPRNLSGGMQQRLALARAIAMDADMLLMDEPLSALDALLREEIQNILLELWQNRNYTQILVTHSIEEAVFLGSRVVIMAPRPGRIVAEIENSSVGVTDYRLTDSFFNKCSEVRQALEEGVRGNA